MKVIENLERKRVERLKQKIKSGDQAIKARKSLYQKMIQYFDRETQERLIRTDKILDKFQTELLVNGGWFTSKYGASTHETNAIDSKYLEYYLPRDIDGFHVQDNTPSTPHQEAVRSLEENFLRTRHLELQIIHMSMLMKDDILYNRKYKIDEEHKEEVEELREILGYNDKTGTILPLQEPQIINFEEVRSKQI